jgi:hypothetical protein
MRSKEKNNSQFESEKELVAVLVQSFKENQMTVRTEVQLFERFIDIIAYDDINFVAIEAKLNSPARAFKQASRYKIISDYTYVAVPKNSTNLKAYKLAEETGIGLLLVSKVDGKYSIETAIESKISDSKNDHIISYIMGLNN